MSVPVRGEYHDLAARADFLKKFTLTFSSPLKLNKDTYTRIKYYAPKAFKTHFLFNLEKLYYQLIKKSHPVNYEKYKLMIKDVEKYIKIKQQQLTLLSNNLLVDVQDPWLLAYTQTKNMSLQEASEHLQDLLFSWEELAKYELEDFIPLDLKDLDDYMQKLEEIYRPLLEKSCPVEDKPLENQKLNELADRISTLRDKIEHHNFSEISHLCQNIRTIVHVTS
ncbi:hypothetical protein DB42_DB00040 [Neochlamydia sp. EPS4]|uniref:hypothetical protein n=1 Tax=Neochlamydia sp. EPS4 TaxID=1478175 RepID=UPI000583DD0E|nr:hypothetical protein [Neochlamydia sp. EPS4]KIC72440.1 hypothetical protein DB42_DB00040 [Neochlamydia sp. EPS4]